MPSKRWVFSGDLAEHLAVTAATIRRWVAEGKIPFIRVSRRTVRFCIADVEAHLAEQAQVRQVAPRRGRS